MSRIRVLPTEVANRIAAGEVIERPASVVKELIENAIDAGADRISVKTQNGGKTLIQVSDNGCGMDADDALLCLEAHATSKIKKTEDIMGIITMGFRGEAIPSIASVSRFHLQTRQQDHDNGTEVLVEHGVLRQHQPCGCASGTHIRISHLFANLPGRRKFLKSDHTEDAHIQECVLMQALAHPTLTFDLTINQRQCFFVPGKIDLKSRIGLLLGKEIIPFLLAVDHEEQNIRVTGFISRPDLTRPGRKEQRVFINHRPAASEAIYHAIRDAYGTLINRGSYPLVILYLEMDPQRVDVNVHPAKREVRFKDERNISFVISNALRHALQQMKTTPFLNLPLSEDDHLPELMPPTTSESKQETVIKSKYLPQIDLPSISGEKTKEISSSSSPRTQPKNKGVVIVTAPPPPSKSCSPVFLEPNNSLQPRKTTIPKAVPSSSLPSCQTSSPLPSQSEISSSPASPNDHSPLAIQLLGQLSSGDIVASGNAGLVLIDPVAAQQRIIFEQLLHYRKNQNDLMLQPLLIPLTLEMLPEDHAILQHHIKQFKEIGFNISPFGGRSVIIETLPAGLPDQDTQQLILEIIEDLRLSGSGKSRSDDLRLAKTAARLAAPPKRILTTIEAEKLIKLLLQTEMPYSTPDGRATMINLPYSEIDRRFLRKK